ncbi:uncharacterized protein M6B38_329840 [Iris pallida]|uniref:Uncharacterized protein n=1 Tax=Iris pallida TaxID=29817 RepID=A0AAX6H474_IRIPA|nr:uncharacterized protein M6B38_329840 [Iris pallida]
MFTEGLDENAISWIKQGTEVEQEQRRSPLIEKYPLDSSTSNTQFYHKSVDILSPKVPQPVKFHSGLLSSIALPPVKPLGLYHGNYMGSEEEDNESVYSGPEGFYAQFSDEDMDTSEDSDLFHRLKNGTYEEEVQSVVLESTTTHEPIRREANTFQRPLARGLSKEHLRVAVGVSGRACTDNKLVTEATTNPYRNPLSGVLHNQQQNVQPNSRGTMYGEFMGQDLGTPSAPPIAEKAREEICLDLEDDTKVVFGCDEVLSDFKRQSQRTEEPPQSTIATECNISVPCLQNSFADQMPCYTTSVQRAWQTFVAYDACFRLCLNAWSRNCLEAPEFLRDECLALRNAFGIQKFLLQPQGHIQREGRQVDNTEGASSKKGSKVIGQIEVEVKKIRIVPRRRKLQATSSQRALYMQVGAEYIRQVTAIMKNQIHALKAASSPAPEEALSCSLQLKSSTVCPDQSSAVYMKPGTGDSHIFFPESTSDELFVEVLDIDKTNQGRATIQISSLSNSQGEIVKWWPLYMEDDGCVGKIQICVNVYGSSEKMNSAKGGPAVETLIYDLVLEAAMRAQHFHPKNLHINGTWKWLLCEFADYYGVSDSYTKLRYLSYIMNIATPTKECLDLLYELLLPVLKARSERSLTRQERSILLDCEDQIKSLLETTFQNYKSLDELSPTGLTDLFGPIQDSAAPALAPAVQIFTILNDILSQEGQNILVNHLMTAAKKRCRRYMVETEEFMLNNWDGIITDPMTISTAYSKIKTLCLYIGREIQADIKIHNQHILPSSIDLPNIVASVYNPQLCNRLRGFLTACPPSKPSPHVAELLIATADFERNLQSWNISVVNGGVVSKDLFHNYIMVWIQDTRLQLLDFCKAEKVPSFEVSTHYATSPFVENMYDQIKDSLNEYEVVINRWPQYLLSLESVVAEIERTLIRSLEKQYNDILMPLKDGIPKLLEKQVQKLKRRQSTSSSYVVPNQLGTFLNTIKRILDVLHCRVEDILKSWAPYLTIANGNTVFGEQMNAVTVVLRKKYKKYMEAIVEKLISNAQGNRVTRLKRILEETKEAEGEAEIRERMHVLCLQLTDSIRNLHNAFSSRIFVAMCRGFWDSMGQIVLSFLESRKENRIWYRGSGYALGILDDLFASEMQTLQGNSLQDKDLDPPRSVVEARSILC